MLLMYVYFPVKGLDFIQSLEGADIDVKEQHSEDFSQVCTPSGAAFCLDVP